MIIYPESNTICLPPDTPIDGKKFKSVWLRPKTLGFTTLPSSVYSRGSEAREGRSVTNGISMNLLLVSYVTIQTTTEQRAYSTPNRTSALPTFNKRYENSALSYCRGQSKSHKNGRERKLPLWADRRNRQ